MRFLGQSFVAAPDGKELVRAGIASEIIYATVQPEKVAVAQRRLPYLEDVKLLKADIC